MSKKKTGQAHLGKLPPLYRFILNPHPETRFSTCPNCGGKTVIRKAPLFIIIKPDYPTAINKHCRYCPRCDILIVHQDELERMLVLAYEKRNPKIIGNSYLVLGTLEGSSWRKRDKQPLDLNNIEENVHDFKEYLDVEYIPAHWGPAKEGNPKAIKR